MYGVFGRVDVNWHVVQQVSLLTFGLLIEIYSLTVWGLFKTSIMMQRANAVHDCAQKTFSCQLFSSLFWPRPVFDFCSLLLKSLTLSTSCISASTCCLQVWTVHTLPAEVVPQPEVDGLTGVLSKCPWARHTLLMVAKLAPCMSAAAISEWMKQL